jgi:hypothetical protein
MNKIQDQPQIQNPPSRQGQPECQSMPNSNGHGAALPNPTDSHPATPSSSALSFRVAQQAAEVLASWRLVYNAYRRRSLINPNPFNLHANLHAFHPNTLVVAGWLGPVPVTTLTVFADPAELPLDRIYPDELASLRQQGRKPVQVGLFADRRRHLARTAEALVELMRAAYSYAKQINATDILIGANPTHARFYSAAFGFEAIAFGACDACLNDHPTTLLRCDMQTATRLDPPPPALAFALANPVQPSVFQPRWDLQPQNLTDPRLEAYLNHLRTRDATAQHGPGSIPA